MFILLIFACALTAVTTNQLMKKRHYEAGYADGVRSTAQKPRNLKGRFIAKPKYPTSAGKIKVYEGSRFVGTI